MEKRVRMMSSCKLEQLPSSLTSFVCSFLWTKDIVCGVRQACRLLNAITRLPTSSPAYMYIPGPSEEFVTMQRILQFPYSASVCLSSSIGIKCMSKLDARMPQLTSVVLGSSSSRIWPRLDLQNLSTLRHIRTITYSCVDSDEGKEGKEGKEKKESSLTRLDLYSQDDIDICYLPTTLVHLDIEKIDTHSAGVDGRWVKSWPSFKRLKHLSIRELEQNDVSLENTLLQIQYKCPNLEYLELGDLIVPVFVRDDIKNSTYVFSRLQTFKLVQNRKTRIGAPAYDFGWLSSMPFLTHLHIQGMNMTRSNMMDCIKSTTTSLSLPSCCITDADLLRFPTHLRSLNLSRDGGIDNLTLLSRMTQLETLVVRNISVRKSDLPIIPSLTCLNAERLGTGDGRNFSLELAHMYPRLTELHLPEECGSYKPLADLPHLTSLYIPQTTRGNDLQDLKDLHALHLSHFSYYPLKTSEDSEDGENSDNNFT